MPPSIILNVIFFIVAWMFRSKWFKIKVHIDIRNSNTSSILTKQSCLLKITWLKKVIPTKSYSLAVALSSSHKIFKSCTTPMTSQAIVSYFWCYQTFPTFTQYMSVSHGHSTMGGIEYDGGGCVEKTKRRKSHIDTANKRAMDMPINWCQCEE